MKICILAAGIGSRMNEYSNLIHKGLLPLDNKAIISHIIEKFGKKNKYIIAIGHNSSQIEDFISLSHPNLNVKYIKVDNYSGKGSGPGYSINSCKNELLEPFIFTACDTIINSNIPKFAHTNWIGIKKVNNISNWCSVKLNNKKIVKNIYYKENVKTNWAFVGIGYVKDFLEFWKGFEKNKKYLKNELQINNGLEELIKKDLLGIPLDWVDVGSYKNYEKAKLKFNKNLTFQGKTTDITYLYGNKVIKFFKDQQCDMFNQLPVLKPRNPSHGKSIDSVPRPAQRACDAGDGIRITSSVCCFDDSHFRIFKIT